MMADSTEMSTKIFDPSKAESSGFKDWAKYFPSLQIDLDCLFPEQYKNKIVDYNGELENEISYTENDAEILLPSIWRRQSRRLSDKSYRLTSLVDRYLYSGGSEIVFNNYFKLTNLQSLLCTPQRNFLVNKHGDKFPVVDENNNYLFKGKYVVICCFLLPVDKDSLYAKVCRAIIAARNQLLKEDDHPPLEVVIVAKMRRDWNMEVVFDHFLSGFPDDFLAIPFFDSKSRDSVCKTLHLTASSAMASLLLDPQGTILGYDAFLDFYFYGADFYPFTDDRVTELDDFDNAIKRNWANMRSSKGHQISPFRFPLQDILGCTTFSSIFSDDESLSVETLGNKLVLLYLCQTGDFLDKLHQFHHNCISHNFDPVIVLVCQPFTQDPSSFFENIKQALTVRSILSWWVLPFSDRISRRLWRLICNRSSDQVIILPPDTTMSAEFNGKSFISKYCLKSGSGYNESFYYPFTREALVESKLSVLKSLTLEKLLMEHGDNFFLKQTVVHIPMYRLRNQKILLYVDNFKANFYLYKLLLARYSDIKVQHKRCKVIFVPLQPIEEKLVPEMPWLTLPSASLAVAHLLFNRFGDKPYPTVVSFGEDGCIRSLNAHRCLFDNYYDEDGDEDGDEDDYDEERMGKKARVDISNLFDDNLRQKIYEDVMKIDREG